MGATDSKPVADETHTYFKVEMSCGGCSAAVTRVLNKVDGVESVAASLDEQQVLVTHAKDASIDNMMEGLKKWAESSGKEISLVPKK